MNGDHRPIPLILKFDDWPAQDRAAWASLFTPSTFFGDGGACANWSEGTRGIRRQGYGQWLSFVLRIAPEMATLDPPARITHEAVQAFIEESKARIKVRSVSNLVLSLAALAQVIAPEKEWQWLWRAGGRLYRQSNPYALKPRIPISAADVFHWSLNRMAQVDQQTGLDALTRAMRFRQALMAGLLITRPVRSRAFSNIRLGRHLEATSSGYRLRFYQEDMKDKRARRYPLPIELEAPMRRYLAEHRPILLGGTETDALWISRRGTPISQDTFTSGLARLTRRHFGLTLRPHAFRHIAATSIAEVDPCHVGMICDILGHATLNMAERHYNRASAVTASSRMQSLVQEIRREAKKSERRSRRRQGP